jgi:DNA-binding response OmpR family regulator
MMTDETISVVGISEPLAGLKLLLVEDDPLVALELDELIRALGGDVVGPFSRLVSALEALQREFIVGAVLDVRLDGERTFPIIDIFLNRADPVLLVTGCAEESLPDKYRGLPRLRKPFDLLEFEQMIRTVFASHNVR